MTRRMPTEFASWNQIACLLRMYLGLNVADAHRHEVPELLRTAVPSFDL